MEETNEGLSMAFDKRIHSHFFDCKAFFLL